MSSSPNHDSDSSSEHPSRVHHITAGGIMIPNITMSMDSSISTTSSASMSMQSIVTGNQFDPFLVLDNRSDMTALTSFFNVPTSLTTQVGMGDGMFYGGDYGVVLENNKLGLGSDISLPPLENIRSNIINEENHDNVVIGMKGHNNNNNNNLSNNNNTCFNNTADHNQGFKVEDVFGYEENHWESGENLRMGDWDLEGLMENLVPSFPFLDFQVE
ncbi:MYB transcriptional factor [Tripterygium wilfordii]|uniref:MYB transcriptional factor n=2 Tax=Tripterygium wilfordii TaxID=458696 RepID=A0A7J7CWW0_TRIWF|nr:MYB transcriptional factor [Tripterygium wilfordii]